MKTQVYQIRALTNLHPGSGDADYGIVDKLVQRDPVTNFPTIHMSSIKGALREYFETMVGPNGTKDDLEMIIRIFGSSPQSSANETRQGKVRFISAELLALPRPSTSDSGPPFEVCYLLENLGAWIKKVSLFDDKTKILVDDKGWQELSNSEFKALSEELPVVARNYLDDGRSKNLWYEEYIPRETQFGCIVQGPEEELDYFHKKLNEKVIQLGGNATVGYGYCLFTSIVKP